jgi:hypothetical protein
VTSGNLNKTSATHEFYLVYIPVWNHTLKTIISTLLLYLKLVVCLPNKLKPYDQHKTQTFFSTNNA